MTFNKRIITAIATGAVLVNAMAPLALADTVTVSGNGALSNNAVNVTNTQATVVNQTNNANITNNVNSSASTGGNSTINAGAASSVVNVTNAANLNKANISCVCSNSGATVNVTGNGAESNNGVGVNNANTVFLNQNNT